MHRRVHAAATAVVGALVLIGASCSAPASPSEPQRPVPTTAPTSTTTTTPGAATSIAVVSDYGFDHDHVSELGDLVRSWDPDYVLTTGDNVQSPLSVPGTDKYDLVVGKHFCEFMADVAPGPHCPSGGGSATNRFFPAIGNHDESDAGLENYESYFTLPGAGTTSTSPTGSELYYDVVLGPVHVFFLDGNAHYRERHLPTAEKVQTAIQRTWLETALRSSTAPWQVVALHYPAYGSSLDYGSQAFAQLPYAEWGADLVLNGHAAVYERVQQGIPYVTNGLGGGHAKPFGFPAPNSVVRFNEEIGAATRLTATATSLRLEAITVEGETIDRVDLG